LSRRRISGLVLAAIIAVPGLSLLWAPAELAWIFFQPIPFDADVNSSTEYPASANGHTLFFYLLGLGVPFFPALIIVALAGVALLAIAFTIQRRVR
jgi:hypothetical protein